MVTIMLFVLTALQAPRNITLQPADFPLQPAPVSIQADNTHIQGSDIPLQGVGAVSGNLSLAPNSAYSGTINVQAPHNTRTIVVK